MQSTLVSVGDERGDEQAEQDGAAERPHRPGPTAIESHQTHPEESVAHCVAARSNHEQVHHEESESRQEDAEAALALAVAEQPHGDDLAEDAVDKQCDDASSEGGH